MTGELAEAGVFIFLMIMGLVFFILVMELIKTRKSQDYRKTLSDMYVAAKIKFLAKEDNLDIVEEFESFKKWCKKQRLHDSEMDLDKTIEYDLKERVLEPTKKAK